MQLIRYLHGTLLTLFASLCNFGTQDLGKLFRSEPVLSPTPYNKVKLYRHLLPW